jgi:hypothetical protein
MARAPSALALREVALIAQLKVDIYPTEKPAKLSYLPCPDVTGQAEVARAIQGADFSRPTQAGTVGGADVFA